MCLYSRSSWSGTPKALQIPAGCRTPMIRRPEATFGASAEKSDVNHESLALME
jgi:hypothetical protein